MSRPIPIAEMATALHRSSDLIKALAMLKVYFEDSGTHGEALDGMVRCRDPSFHTGHEYLYRLVKILAGGG